MHSPTVFTIYSLFLAVSLPAQQTFIVDPSGEGDFTQVQPAVDAADPGDIIRVEYGRYSPVTISKGVRLLAEPWRGEHVIIDYIEVVDLPRDEVLIVADLQTLHLTARDCAGDMYLSYMLGSIEMVHCQSVTAYGCGLVDTYTAVTLEDSRAFFVDCHIFGGGHTGIYANRSKITVVDGILTGGSFGRSGTPAAILRDSEAVYSPTARISPGYGLFGDPGRVVELRGQSRVWRAPHSLSVEPDELLDQMLITLTTGYVQPHVMVAGSLPSRPIELPEGDFYLDHGSLQVLFAGISSRDEPRDKALPLLPPFSPEIHRRDFVGRNPPAGAGWLGIAFTFQAVVTDRNGDRLLSLPYTIVF